MDTNYKIALVTGGSRGLGRDMALRLAEKGIGVIVTYNSREDEAAKVVNLIEQNGGRATALQLNTGAIKSFDGFIELVKETLTQKFGTDKLDFLVNNAGVGAIAPFAEVTEEAFDDLYNIHYKGVYFLTQKMLPVLNDGGGIVNISSGLARFAMPGSSAYASMKGAVEVFTRYLARELGARGIRANVVAPGAIMTDFNGAHVRNSEQLQNVISGLTALGRPGVAEDIGGIVAFLCTEDARWITGQRIEASGGMYV